VLERVQLACIFVLLRVFAGRAIHHVVFKDAQYSTRRGGVLIDWRLFPITVSLTVRSVRRDDPGSLTAGLQMKWLTSVLKY
jgi:hypothetical protein